MHVLVGLGNPGPGYAGTRHNVGRMVLAEVARRCGAGFSRHRTGAAVAETRLAPLPGPRVVLVEPRGYMNECGGSVKAVVNYFKVDPAELLVLHDELDLAFGQVRLKAGGGHGGHNGLRSVMSALGTSDFARLRIGIGRPPGRQDAADFVLRPYPAAQRGELELQLQLGADAAEDVVRQGLPTASNHVNQKAQR